MRSVLILSSLLFFVANGCDVFMPDVGGAGQECSKKNTCKEGLTCRSGVCCRTHWQGDGCGDCPVNWDAEQDCNACTGNWDPARDCAECLGNWDKTQGCSACLPHWQDNDDDCGTCEGNWNIQQDCTGCVGNWDSAQDCNACLNQWQDNSDDCGTCPGNWDASQECADCKGHWDNTQNCTVCLNQWVDNSDDCGTCPGNWDPAQDCADCVGNWDPGQGCSVCAGNWVDAGDDCGTCAGNWDSAQDCNACLNHWEDNGDDCGTCPPNWDAGQECDACLTGWSGEFCEKVTDCNGQPDFTLCDIDTPPNDYYYDICVQDDCISPGCDIQSCNAPGPHFTLADTGQRQCYNETGEIPCPDTAGALTCETTAYCGQDYQYGWDVNNPASARFHRNEPVLHQPVVTDFVTGLIWQGCHNDFSGADCLSGLNNTRTWRQALEHCDGLDWGGFTDWHLPDEYELLSIVDYNNGGGSSQAIDLVYFPQTPGEHFWTSSTAHGDQANAMAIEFGSGNMSADHKDGSYHTRCVRFSAQVTGGAVGPRFTVDNTTEPGEPVVTDNVTGLDWQGCLDGKSGGDCSTGSITTYTWPPAVSRCQELDWGGHDDWYLPDIKQLHSITDNLGGNPSVDPTIFPGSEPQVVWSSTSIAPEPTKAWVVHFVNGRVEGGVDNNKEDSRAIRCVRDGS